MTGWGGSGWGGSGWGGYSLGGGPLVVNGLVAVAENVLQVQFASPIYFSGLLDSPDGSNPAIWTISPVAGTTGYDGQPARLVSVASVALADATAQNVNLTTDRPMSPYPAQYVVTVNGAYSADLTTQARGQTASTLAVYRVINSPQIEAPAPGRDFANPQTLRAAQASTIAQPAQTILGSLGYSGDGDYAIDQGDEGLRKRLTRRTFCRKNGFAFLPGYGVGARQRVKTLATTANREALAADCEAQYSQEPEVQRTVVSSHLDSQRPNLARLAVVIVKKDGRSVKYTSLVPVQ